MICNRKIVHSFPALASYTRNFLVKCFQDLWGVRIQDSNSRILILTLEFLLEYRMPTEVVEASPSLVDWHLFSACSCDCLTPLCDSLSIFCIIRIWSTVVDWIHCLLYYCLTKLFNSTKFQLLYYALHNIQHH